MSSTLTAQRGRMGLLQRQLDASDRDLERLTARVDAQLQRIDAVINIITMIFMFMTGSSRAGCASSVPFLSAMEAAILKAMSEESTGCSRPSTRLT